MSFSWSRFSGKPKIRQLEFPGALPPAAVMAASLRAGVGKQRPIWFCLRSTLVVAKHKLRFVKAMVGCGACVAPAVCRNDRNLVDPASSHTLVSKIKPCMSKYKRFYTVKLRMAHYISYSLFDSPLLLG